MRIWIIGRGYPTTSNKMWGSFELEQAKLLARNHFDVVYIALTLSFFSRNDKRGLRSFNEEGVQIYTYSRLYFPGKAGLYFEKFEDKCWKKLFKKAENDNGKPDIIHVHYPSMISSINEIEKYRRSGVRVFVTEHWSRVLTARLRKHEIARLQYYANYASCFISVGNSLEEAVRKTVEVKVPMTIIPNIVSPVFFETDHKKKDDGFTFIIVGRLVPLKQFDVVINAFKELFSENKSVRLEVVGSGEERKNLEKQASCDNIVFWGELISKEVAEKVSESDALISFSKYETFAVPVAEALACGKPVIVSDTAGIATYINDNNGIVVSSKDKESLKEAMVSIIDNYGRFDHNYISNYAQQCFSDKSVYKQLNSLYQH